ncbi:hypothetical protein LZU85_09425 [Vibrio sp. IRLE0018]|uniref:hypothetical protein n=1 Tax=Vibrio TaxID=662 RepID=UPI00159323D8|nr:MULTISPECIES: hypothetical protein [Vibrio]MCF8779021.1 hypothetical protein [Vibrio floridensis]NVC61836.1 hypothetical protein [Vibrio sp. 05-20-BW147]HAS6347670.1 hypothetical protein [Vibrio vulnificus]HAS6350517.1 hypothetical protein [Vibrio vulnificus]
MFTFLSALVSVVILASLFYLAHKRERHQENKYLTVATLREIVQLARQHRTATHLSLLYKQVHSNELRHVQVEIINKCQILIDIAPHDNKALYRILLNQFQSLFGTWCEQSIARNQLLHGKLIRHSLYLIDETTVAWLSECERDELIEEYHCHWQVVIENLDALTQLRIVIQEIHQPQGIERFQFNAERVLRRLNQLSLVSPLTIASPFGSELTRTLEAHAQGEMRKISKVAIYELTSQISTIIFQCYDNMLDEMIESLYLPLPKLAIA